MALTDDEVIELVRPNSKQSRERLAGWVRGLRAVDAGGVEGDVVECGVYRGASIAAARLVSPDRHCWLYDTFAGATRPGPEDVSRSGRRAADSYEVKKDWMAASLDDVVKYITEAGAYDHRKLTFVEGDVLATLRDPRYDRPAKIAALRLDTDWYASTKLELEVLYPLLQPGGVLVIDDYGHWHGARKAVDEYLGPDVKWEQLDYTGVMTHKGG